MLHTHMLQDPHWQIQYLYTFIIIHFLLCLCPCCVNAAEERHDCRFWRSSAEEAAGCGGLVQPSPLPIHLHPGPGPEDPWSAPTAQKLRETHTNTDTGQDLNFPFFWATPGTFHELKTFCQFAFSGHITHFYWSVPSLASYDVSTITSCDTACVCVTNLNWFWQMACEDLSFEGVRCVTAKHTYENFICWEEFDIPFFVWFLSFCENKHFLYLFNTCLIDKDHTNSHW